MTALLSVLGNALGLLVQVLAVALGLGAVVAASATAYTVLKLVGAAWVVWLGIQAIRHRGDARRRRSTAVDSGRPSGAVRPLWTGFIVGSTNPKTIVFFVAFLPQFTNPAAGHVGLQVAAARRCSSRCWPWRRDSAWALAASRARDWFAREPRAAGRAWARPAA